MCVDIAFARIDTRRTHSMPSLSTHGGNISEICRYTCICTELHYSTICRKVAGRCSFVSGVSSELALRPVFALRA